MQSNNWREHAASVKPLIETGREWLPLVKYPRDLGFTKTIGGTTYAVNSHFSQNASESMLRIILRWIDNGTDVAE